MKRIISLTILMTMLFAVLARADGINSLTLSNEETQKLKKYFPADEESHIVWRGEPISIHLPIGSEKRLVFSSHVIVDVKGSLSTKQIRLLNNDKSIYLTALTPFQSTRIYVTAQETGKVILLDLDTANYARAETQYIEIKQETTTVKTRSALSTTSTMSASDNNSSSMASDEYNPVDLIRFAWQQTFAPERLLKKSINFNRVPMQTQKFISDLVYGDKVIAHPEASWMSNNHYVTVVTLRNKYAHMTHIDIRKDICGDWQAATIYPRSTLSPYGIRHGDTTTLFLISQRSFAETLGVCHGDA
jgi:integrating conjugative element protein (TIGR03749 family)